MKAWTRATLYVIAGLCLMGGCPTREGKYLVEQTRLGGGFVAENADDPTVAQAGQDVADNMATFQTTDGYPAPADAPPYTPENSAQSRKRATEEANRRTSLLDGAKALLAKNPWGAAIVAAVTTAWGWVERRKKNLANIENNKHWKLALSSFEGVKKFKNVLDGLKGEDGRVDPGQVYEKLIETLEQRHVRHEVAIPADDLVKHVDGNGSVAGVRGNGG